MNNKNIHYGMKNLRLIKLAFKKKKKTIINYKYFNIILSLNKKKYFNLQIFKYLF